MFANTQSEYKKQKAHENNVKQAELLLSAFVSEHNVAFLTIDHLVDVLKRIDPS